MDVDVRRFQRDQLDFFLRSKLFSFLAHAYNVFSFSGMKIIKISDKMSTYFHRKYIAWIYSRNIMG